VFGIGMALMEQTIYDPNTARVLTETSPTTSFR
jgi:CO/xanthine dehydrogenase Mo-binding subunit